MILATADIEQKNMASLPIANSFNSSIFHDVWKYDLINISGNNIKVSNIIIALILLFLGLRFSKKITRFTIKLLSKKLKEDADTIYTIERLISYALFIITIFVALQIANIPLGIFAFIGGALAIGIVLGAQGVVTNFINTIVIMVEKPVKIGDVIEIQETVGRVKAIGTRCITIDSIDSGEILIPNAILIQNKLSKWTHAGNKTSYHVYVNIPKENNAELQHDLIINQLKLVAKDLDFIAPKSEVEIYLTSIEKLKDQFCLSFLGNANLVKGARDIRHKINLALLQHLKNNFNVEYSRNLGNSKKSSYELTPRS